MYKVAHYSLWTLFLIRLSDSVVVIRCDYPSPAPHPPYSRFSLCRSPPWLPHCLQLVNFNWGPPIIFPPCDSNYLQICECSFEIQDVLLEVVCNSGGKVARSRFWNIPLVQSDLNIATGSLEKSRLEEPGETVNPISLILQIVMTAFVFHLGDAPVWSSGIWRMWLRTKCSTIGYEKNVALGTAVFHNHENGPDSSPLYFSIWRIFTQITQASLIWVEVQITEGGCNCRRHEANLWESTETDCTGRSIIGDA